ncbi:hypothetical protein MGYG_09096 [Nannizzia gypsea CBS 118893]|uniref:Uncharacterized protein n=1 Tax=Arthroderma gypseum (strain ATCC MYA-4604 / CBS 118893) TaxID=535722 RepID=E4UX99_ARTGP|nr:hypothetical protein MGYG_09096 [Nannizzia gypsea CBS 118893]EFR02686.1 hypothetical protein MGYG_09096 [Nannizzia gypsea CBS 118893]
MEPTRRINRWTRDEDAILLREFNKQETASNDPTKTTNWQKIALSLPGRSNKDCRKRWFNVLSGDLRKGLWTPEEDRLLAQAIESEGKVWIRVAHHIPHRTADQCAKRWQHALDPALDRSKWTHLESQSLWNAVQTHGRCWLRIRNELFPSRSPNALKNHYTFLSRNVGRTCMSSPEPSHINSNPYPYFNNEGMVHHDPKMPIYDETDSISETRQLDTPSGTVSPFPTAHEDMLMTAYDLSSFDFSFDEQQFKTVTGEPGMPNCTGDDALWQQGSAADFLLGIDSPPGHNRDHCGGAIPGNSLRSHVLDDQLGVEQPGVGISPVGGLQPINGTFQNRSVMTVTVADPGPELVNDFVRVLLNHQQEVSIDFRDIDGNQ